MNLLLCGKKGSGKSTAVQIISDKYDINVLRAGSLIDARISESDKIICNETRLRYSFEMRSATRSGSLFEYAVLNPNKINLFDSIVYTSDLNYVRNLGEHILLGIILLDDQERFVRINKRNRPDDCKNIEDMLKMERENMPDIPEILKQADILVENNGGYKKFQSDLLSALRGKL